MKIPPALLSAVFGLVLFASFQAQCQDTPTRDSSRQTASEQEPVDPADSEYVEESDEAFRRRMETEEGRRSPDQKPIPSRPAAPPPEGMDALPEESQKHLRNQLRQVIMKNGPWQEQHRDLDYPYQPSIAAQSDDALQQAERDAWEKLIEEYHQREAAAAQSDARLAPQNPPGIPGGQADAAPGNNTGTASGVTGAAGNQDGSGSESARASGPGSSGSGSQGAESGKLGSNSATGSTEPPPQPRVASQRPAPPGVTQSAAEYLRRLQTADIDSEAAPGAAGTSASNEPVTTPPAGSIAIEELDKLQGIEEVEEDR